MLLVAGSRVERVYCSHPQDLSLPYQIGVSLRSNDLDQCRRGLCGRVVVAPQSFKGQN